MIQYDVLQVDDQLCIFLNIRFKNLLTLIEHYKRDDSLGLLVSNLFCLKLLFPQFSY